MARRRPRKMLRLEIEDQCLLHWSESEQLWTCVLFCWGVWKTRRRRVMRTVRGRTKGAVGRALDTFMRRRGVTLLPKKATARG